MLALWTLASAPRGYSAAPETSAAEELQAARLLETALTARDAEPAEWRKLSQIYRGLETRHPSVAAIRTAHGELLWKLEKKDAAVKKWHEAVALQPTEATALNHLGGSYLTAGQPARAVEFYERATQAEPANAMFHFNLANVSFMFRHEMPEPEEAVFKRALTHFAEASRLLPGNPEFARAYAETFYLLPQPDWKEALAAWKRFYEVTQQKEFALANLARVHMKLGEKAEARACLAQVQSPEYQRLKTRLTQRIDTEE
jgi:tetratricopeptide (TPR) repeat protein